MEKKVQIQDEDSALVINGENVHQDPTGHSLEACSHAEGWCCSAHGGFITHTRAPLTASQLAHRMQGIMSFITKTPKEELRSMEEPSSNAIWQRNL